MSSVKRRPLSRPRTSLPSVKSVMMSASDNASPPSPARNTTVSEPLPVVMVSEPVPPSKVLSPADATKVSLPASPFRVSFVFAEEAPPDISLLLSA